MRISDKTIERLIEIITGNNKRGPYRFGPQLIKFFRDFGEHDLCEQGFPSRVDYVREKLMKFNGTETMERIISSAFDFFDEERLDSEKQVEAFNLLLAQDGYRLVIEYQSHEWGVDSCFLSDPYVEIHPVLPPAVLTQGLAAISHDAIHEQISKVHSKISTEDFIGAIASSYTLTEHLLKLILQEATVAFNENEGDIRTLYRLVRESLNLNSADEEIAALLKPILNGLQKLVSGLYEISNKASERHAWRYDPAGCHAKLAANAALTLCEFLVESRDYQRSQSARSTKAGI